MTSPKGRSIYISYRFRAFLWLARRGEQSPSWIKIQQVLWGETTIAHPSWSTFFLGSFSSYAGCPGAGIPGIKKGLTPASQQPAPQPLLAGWYDGETAAGPLPCRPAWVQYGTVMCVYLQLRMICFSGACSCCATVASLLFEVILLEYLCQQHQVTCYVVLTWSDLPATHPSHGPE
jgi:hypothetical protein